MRFTCGHADSDAYSFPHVQPDRNGDAHNDVFAHADVLSDDDADFKPDNDADFIPDAQSNTLSFPDTDSDGSGRHHRLGGR